ncbi:MAG: hypothetical protein GY925_15630 [Actinomycetia bacterium]|nr:hypothetical protein [Actinomycetes bacterium]
MARANLGLELDDTIGSDTGAVGYCDGHVVALVESRPDRAVGRAFGVARKHGASQIDILCQQGAGLVARRCGPFEAPTSVWQIDGTSLSEAEAEPVGDPVPPPDVALAFVPSIEAAGATAVVEHGVVVGEVRGLEVARVVVDEGGPRLLVGVSTDDRIMNELIHPEQPAQSVLAQVVEAVAPHRTRGADPHPFNRLSRERWLRSMLIDEPSLVGFDWLAAAPPPAARVNLSDPAPAVALGARGGAEAVVVISCGVDLELVPFAADARLHLAPSGGLVIVVPERDAVGFTRGLVGSVRDGAELATVPNDWFGL